MSMVKILRTSRALAVTAACIGIFTLGIQQAQAISLQDLFDGQSITANDKLFDNFVLLQNFNPPLGSNVSDIVVTALTGDPSNPGLRYEGNGALLSQQGFLAQFAFSYRVSVDDPTQFLIKDNTLDLTDFSFGTNVTGGKIVIIENVGTTFLNNDLVADKRVEADEVNGGDPPVTVPLTSQEEEIFVVTTIGLLGSLIVPGAMNGDIEVISFEQRFSQAPQGVSGPPGGVIPEPGTLSLLGIGLAGLALHQWRRKKWALQ